MTFCDWIAELESQLGSPVANPGDWLGYWRSGVTPAEAAVDVRTLANRKTGS